MDEKEGGITMGMELVKSLFVDSKLVREVGAHGKSCAHSIYIPFVADEITMKRVKEYVELHASEFSTINVEGTTLCPLAFGVNVEHGPVVERMYRSSEKIFVNLLAENAFELLEYLWSKCA
jgi:hypothetical protein